MFKYFYNKISTKTSSLLRYIVLGLINNADDLLLSSPLLLATSTSTFLLLLEMK